MDRTEDYRSLVKRLLSEKREFIVQHNREEKELWCAFDDERGQYLLLNTGWRKGVRHNGATLYLRVQNGKIYVEEDWLEDGIVSDLLANGVPPQDVVLAWQPPELRSLTQFAVA